VRADSCNSGGVSIVDFRGQGGLGLTLGLHFAVGSPDHGAAVAGVSGAKGAS
jgi:hypothetical protein